MLSEKVKKIKQLVLETSGTTMSIRMKETSWVCDFLQKKQKFENENFETLCDEVINYIESSREKVEVKGKQVKPYKIV